MSYCYKLEFLINIEHLNLNFQYCQNRSSRFRENPNDPKLGPRGSIIPNLDPNPEPSVMPINYQLEDIHLFYLNFQYCQNRSNSFQENPNDPKLRPRGSVIPNPDPNPEPSVMLIHYQLEDIHLLHLNFQYCQNRSTRFRENPKDPKLGPRGSKIQI